MLKFGDGVGVTTDVRYINSKNDLLSSIALILELIN